MSNIQTGSTGARVDTFTREEEGNTVHMQAVVPVDPATGVALGASEDAALQVHETTNWLLRAMSKVFGRLSFNSTSELRTVVGSGTITTVTTCTTVATANMGFGDAGKTGTLIMMSRSAASNHYSRLTQV